MYKFTKQDDPNVILGDSSYSNFTELLKNKWDFLHDKTNIFRYKINYLEEKMIDGKYLMQLNPDRGCKRRMPEKLQTVSQPFDVTKFNFTKISKEEIIFNVVKENNESNIHTLVVNVSPITRYHTLLCPSLEKCYPQVITEESLVIALDVIRLANDRDLRIGFNSLCGLASVNHLHYHLFFEANDLPVEIASCKHIAGQLFCLQDYPVPAFCFQLLPEESTIDKAKQTYKLVSYLLENSIAHNVFITRGQHLENPSDKQEIVRIVIWPRKSSAGVKQLDAFNVAVCELSGWFPVYDKIAYDNFTTENLELELTKWKLDNFETICIEVKKYF